MEPVTQKSTRVQETAIANGVSSVLANAGLKALIGSKKVNIVAEMVKNAETGKYIPEVTVTFPKGAQVEVNGEQVAVVDVIKKMMSLGDEARLATIRKGVPTYGQNEGETLVTQRVWAEVGVFPGKKEGVDVAVFRRNPSFSLTVGL